MIFSKKTIRTISIPKIRKIHSGIWKLSVKNSWNYKFWPKIAKFWSFKAMGSRAKIHVELIWKRISIRSQRFLQNIKIQFLAHDIYVWVRLGMAKIAPFPCIFQYKNNAENESKSWIFSLKIGFKHVWWCFFM